MPSITTATCQVCKKKRAGRYTVDKAVFTKGHTRPLPAWHCYTCLPAGMGDDESQETAVQHRAATVATIAKVIPETKPERQEEIRKDSEALVVQLKGQILPVIDQESLTQADVQLSRVQTARKTIATRMEKIIRPIRSGLDELYKLNRELDRPLEAMEKEIKGEMKAFHLEQQRQIDEARQEAQRQEWALLAQARKKEEAAQQAKTPAARTRLQQEADALQDQAVEVSTAEMPIAAVTMHSSSRPIKRWTAPDLLRIVKGVAAGEIPVEAVQLNYTFINRTYKEDAEGVTCWPGIVIIDDVEIRGR